MNKSELKKAYKQANRPMGIYILRSPKNHLVFIGAGTDMQAKINRHKAELKFGKHRNRELQKLWDSSGGQNLEFEVLDVLEHEEDSRDNPAEELKVLLEMWVQKLVKPGETIVRL